MMDTKNQLLNEKDKLLKQIASSAQHGNSQEVLSAGEKLKKIESLIDRHEKLLRDISDLGNEPIGTNYLQNSRESPKIEKSINEINVTPGRGIGKTIRMDFLKKLSEKGIYLKNIKGSGYETKSGSKVGIAVATERKADRWFLGLPVKYFDQAILLCKKDVGDVMEICIPKIFFEEYGGKMCVRDGQMKFNVVRKSGGYTILVPRTDGVNVSKFIENYSPLT